jgi:hypothetical protein
LRRLPVGTARSSRLQARGAILLALAGGLTGGPARAGAWLLAPGEGHVVASAGFSQGERYFDEKGKLIPQANYRKFELPVFIEYGVSERVTVIVSPSLLRLDVVSEPPSSFQGPGYTDLGGRLRLWAGGTQVLSLQATARLPGATRADGPASLGWTGPEVDMRLLWGRSFELWSWPAFVDAQVGYRTRGGGPADEIRLDLTLGARPHPRWLVLLQSFSAASVGEASPPFRMGQSHKVAVSAAYTIGRFTLQAGGIATIAGQNALRERGFITALWFRF